MEFNKLVTHIEKQMDGQNYIEFDPEFLSSLRLDQVEAIIDKFLVLNSPDTGFILQTVFIFL